MVYKRSKEVPINAGNTRLRAVLALAAAGTLIVCVLGGCATSRPGEPFTPALEGPISVPDSFIRQLDELVRREMDANAIPGLAIGVVTRDGLAWGGGYGVVRSGSNEAVTADTRFPIASVTKPLTAVAVMTLVEDGRVALSAPVSRYLPRFSPPPPRDDGDRPITVRHLLSHHGGLVRDYRKGMVGPSSEDVDIVSDISTLLLANPPGTVYRYSNVGYAVLGELIEAASGSSYEEYVGRALFSPLGMGDTRATIGVSAAESGRFAAGHERTGLVFSRMKPVEPATRRDTAAGAAVSTVRDLARFVTMLLNEGETADGRALLRRESVAELFDTPFPRRPLDEDDYALGFKIGKMTSDPVDVRHGGTLDGYATLIALVPEHGVGIVILSNADQPFARHHIANEAIRLWIDAELDEVAPRPTVAVPPERLDALSGHYVGVGDFSLHLELDVPARRLVLSGEELALEQIDDAPAARYRVVKRIAGIGFPVAGAFGAHHAHLDFVSVADELLPRVVLTYAELPLEMPFIPIAAPEVRIPSTRRTRAGDYELAADSRRFAPPGLTAVTIFYRDGLMFADLNAGGISRMVLEPADLADSSTGLAGEVYQALGTGETFSFRNGVLRYSGLSFERR